eukprot:8452189-Pyramimonas_sp.AAC.1
MAEASGATPSTSSIFGGSVPVLPDHIKNWAHRKASTLPQNPNKWSIQQRQMWPSIRVIAPDAAMELKPNHDNYNMC